MTSTHVTGGTLATLSPAEEKARALVKAFRGIQPTLTAYAKVVTRSNRVRVELASNTTAYTDGNVIYYRPPSALADKRPHLRNLCDKRDESQQLRCPACALREQIMVVIYHELAHIAFGSFAQPTDDEKKELFEEALRLVANQYGKEAAERVAKADWAIKTDYNKFAQVISKFLPMLLNAVEDARINSEQFKARRGTKAMFDADMIRLVREGVEQLDGEGNTIFKHYNEYPQNMQIILGILCKCSGYDYSDWFIPEIVDALNDEELTKLTNQTITLRSVKGSYMLAIPILMRLKELGFLLDDYDKMPEPESDDESGGESSDESDDESTNTGDESTTKAGQPDEADTEPKTAKSDKSDEAAERENSGSSSGSTGSSEDDEEDNETDEDDFDYGSSFSEAENDEDEPESEEEGEAGSEEESEAENEGDSTGSGEVEPEPEELDDPSDSMSGKPEMGSPDDPGFEMPITSGHPTPLPPLSYSDFEEEKTALERAIVQDRSFEKPSTAIWGIREHWYDKHCFEGEEDASYAWTRWDSSIFRNQDYHAPESVLGPILLKLRTVFSDNRRGREERNLKRGKVDPKTVGKRAWHNDPRLFKHKTLPGKKDYIVLIVLDISGSTMGAGRIELIKQTAFAQAELLSRMGIKFAMIAHTGNSAYDKGMCCDIYHIKDADEPWDKKTQEHLVTIGSVAYNLDGHTLEYCRKWCDKRRESGKVILYFSDGSMPLENYSEELEVLQREIKICRQKRYTLLGVGIHTDSPRQHGLETVEVNSISDLTAVANQLGRKLIELDSR